MGVTRGTGTANPSGAPEFITGFWCDRVAQSSVFCVVFCRYQGRIQGGGGRTRRAPPLKLVKM